MDVKLVINKKEGRALRSNKAYMRKLQAIQNMICELADLVETKATIHDARTETLSMTSAPMFIEEGGGL